MPCTIPPCTKRSLAATLGACSMLLLTPAYGQVINEDNKFLPFDSAGGNFGFSMAQDNGLLVIGAMSDNPGGIAEAGSAYLIDATTGAHLFKLVPNDPEANDHFGWSVDIHNGLIVVGAVDSDDNGTNSGSAYVFDATTGTQLVKLLPTDGGIYDAFGYSVAIHNGIVGVGARYDDDDGLNAGAAYLFDASSGFQLGKLLASDGAEWGRFGASMAMDAGTIVVGAERQANKGAVYAFDTTSGIEFARLVADDATNGRYFGSSVDIDNGIVAVGDYFDQTMGWNAGSAYLFDLATQTQQAKIYASDPTGSMDYFGNHVALSGGLLVVGSSGHGFSDSGAAYIFDVSTATQIAELRASDASFGARLGKSVAIDNGSVWAGASTAQAVYTFTAPNTLCQADLTGDGALDFFDVSAFLAAFSSQDPIADFTADGNFDFFDISAFLAAFTTGCP